MSKLYVGNLPSDCNESALRQLFQEHSLACTTILVKRGGYAFVDCADQSTADRAIDKLNGYTYLGSSLVVEPSVASAAKKRITPSSLAKIMTGGSQKRQQYPSTWHPYTCGRSQKRGRVLPFLYLDEQRDPVTESTLGEPIIPTGSRMFGRFSQTLSATVFIVNMSLDKFAEGGMLQKEMERLEIEEKNGDSPR
ncbi:Insulin-like growth factor 2 mRNA-binding protein 3-A [Atta colombica]|uniref:Insulin-like growth factor 2 mRNA-binding protein 3-A n=1 Tax=Atta colombica TaxID=520822 RepID=A0A151I4J7_9HYME|nr:Insulin-like growth factor 2 mRNA-binding protein 3-A [Atta colombica]